ncbi:MAG: hypothetical protein WBA01_06345 [Phormidesmis sp.]
MRKQPVPYWMAFPGFSDLNGIRALIETVRPKQGTGERLRCVAQSLQPQSTGRVSARKKAPKYA